MSLQSIRKKALAGSLEVEHLLREAKLGTPGLGQLLLQLSEQLGWSFEGLAPDGSRRVPLAAWATVVAAYSNAGLPGLQSFARDSTFAPFVIGVAEELKTSEALAFLLKAFASAVAQPERDLEVSFCLARALNLMLSFKPAAPVQEDQSEVIQLFLFRLHQLARTEAEAAVALLALRGVGSADAAAFVRASAHLAPPWAEVQATVLRAIRKRLQTLPSNPSVKGTSCGKPQAAPYVER
jgi:hypothetical protein